MAFGIATSSSKPSGLAGLLKRPKSYHDIGFEEPEDEDYLQEKGYGAVATRDWSGRYDDRYADNAWNIPASQNVNMAGCGVPSAHMAAQHRLDPSNTRGFASIHRRGGLNLHRSLPGIPDEEPFQPGPAELDEFLAQSRTGYTPAEAANEFGQQRNSGVVSGMLRNRSHASSSRNTRRRQTEDTETDGASYYDFSGVTEDSVNKVYSFNDGESLLRQLQIHG